MPRPSAIDRLDGGIRDLIGRLREQGRTIDEILAKLRELDVEVSRSSLGRHIQEIDRIGEQMRRSRAVAEALVARFGDQPDNRLARLNIELMHGVVMQLVTAAADSEGGSPVVLDAEQAMFVARALQSLASAAKSDQDRIVALKKELAKETAKAVEKVAGDAAAAGKPLDGAEVLRKIREDVYGIFER